MKKYGQTFLHRSLSLALAAALAVSAAGCSGGGAHTSSAPSAAPQASTVTAALPSGSGAEPSVPGTIASVTDGTSASAVTADNAGTGTDPAGSAMNAPDSAAGAAAASAQTAADGSTAAAAPTTPTEGSTSTKNDTYTEDASAGQTKADTALKESLLSEALMECTGWGQSAGSSLRAAAAAVKLLEWANQAEAGSADSALLADTVKKEVGRLSDSQKENLKSNWSSVSYDASKVLDDFDEISPILEDAGCAEDAKAAAENKDALKNWEAAEHALDAALK